MKTIAIKSVNARPKKDVDERVIVYPECGSPYYIAADGLPVFISPPGTPMITSEDVRRELEDFP
jgi:hypothetical protein